MQMTIGIIGATAMPGHHTAAVVMGAARFLDGAKAERDLDFAARLSVGEAVERAPTCFRRARYIKQ
jgi:hypothetical protein